MCRLHSPRLPINWFRLLRTGTGALCEQWSHNASLRSHSHSTLNKYSLNSELKSRLENKIKINRQSKKQFFSNFRGSITVATLNWHSVVTALRLRSGYIHSKKFNFSMEITSTPHCSNCSVIEDVYYELITCVRTGSLRSQLGAVGLPDRLYGVTVLSSNWTRYST